MQQLLAVGLGGFIGAIARYAMSGIVYRYWGTGFPYGTFAVNILGCFILGFFAMLSEERTVLHPLTRNLIAVGLLGSFTTFSTFSYETLMLVRDGSLLSAGVNIAASLLLGLLAVYAGIVLARVI